MNTIIKKKKECIESTKRLIYFITVNNVIPCHLLQILLLLDDFIFILLKVRHGIVSTKE